MQKHYYQETRIGLIPKDWQYVQFIDFYAEPSRNGIYKSAEFQGHGIKIVNMKEIFAFDFISNQEMSLISVNEKEKNINLLKHGDLLFGRRSIVPEGAGKCSIVINPIEPIVFESSIIRVRTNQSVYSLFLYYLFSSPIGRKIIDPLISGTNIKGIRGSDLQKSNIPLPPIAEQRKIAEILGTCDRQIELTEKVIEAKRKLKRGLMQKLFSQEIRFKREDGSNFSDWEKRTLGYHIDEYQKKSTIQDEYKVFTSSQTGLLLQSEYYENSRITERNNVGFNIIPPNFITYRSRSDNGLFFFNENKLSCTGLVSIYYPVFTIKNGSSSFFIKLLNLNQKYIGKYSVGTSQKVLSMNELKRIKFFIPSQEEQIKIGSFLDYVDKEIKKMEEQNQNIKYLKKGLMQQLLTGKTRVKVD